MCLYVPVTLICVSYIIHMHYWLAQFIIFGWIQYCSQTSINKFSFKSFLRLLRKESRGWGSWLVLRGIYGKLTRFRRLLDFAKGNKQECLENPAQCWIHVEHNWLSWCLVGIGVAGSFVSKRIENGRRTFDKTGKVGMLIIVFWFAENTKSETDFIRAEV